MIEENEDEVRFVVPKPKPVVPKLSDYEGMPDPEKPLLTLHDVKEHEDYLRAKAEADMGSFRPEPMRIPPATKIMVTKEIATPVVTMAVDFMEHVKKALVYALDKERAEFIAGHTPFTPIAFGPPEFESRDSRPERHTKLVTLSQKVLIFPCVGDLVARHRGHHEDMMDAISMGMHTAPDVRTHSVAGTKPPVTLDGLTKVMDELGIDKEK